MLTVEPVKTCKEATDASVDQDFWENTAKLVNISSSFQQLLDEVDQGGINISRAYPALPGLVWKAKTKQGFDIDFCMQNRV